MGFYTTFSNAVYAYSGIETISMAAAETESPRRNIPIAAKRIFWRVTIFYGRYLNKLESTSSVLTWPDSPFNIHGRTYCPIK
jgi:L-asparagine transporter-like permease